MKPILYLIFRQTKNKIFRIQSLVELMFLCALSLTTLQNISMDWWKNTTSFVFTGFLFSITFSLVLLCFGYYRGFIALSESDHFYLENSPIPTDWIVVFGTCKKLYPIIKIYILFAFPLCCEIVYYGYISPILLLIIQMYFVKSLLQSYLLGIAWIHLNQRKRIYLAFILAISLLLSYRNIVFLIVFDIIGIVTIKKTMPQIRVVNTNEKAYRDTKKHILSPNMEFKGHYGALAILRKEIIEQKNQGKNVVFNIKFFIHLALTILFCLSVTLMKDQNNNPLQTDILVIIIIFITSLITQNIGEEKDKELKKVTFRLLPISAYAKYFFISLVSYIRACIVGCISILFSCITLKENFIVFVLSVMMYMSVVFVQSGIKLLCCPLLDNFDKNSIFAVYMQIFITIALCLPGFFSYFIARTLGSSMPIASFVMTATNLSLYFIQMRIGRIIVLY